MDEELKRIEEEIRKAKEKRQVLEDRKNRRMKQIRAKQERDRAFWLKKMSTVLDRTLSEMKGKTYFYEITQDQIAYALKKGGIPEKVPGDTQKKAANEAAKACSGTGAEKKEAGR
jgi:hypothetical protein